jgi:galactokinase
VSKKSDIFNLLKADRIKSLFSILYGKEKEIFELNIRRYEKLVNQFVKKFGDGDIQLFSTPGRTEIGGNHTDHNDGRVLAASVNLDSIGAVTKSDNNVITLYSEGFENPFIVDLSGLDPVAEEKGSTTSLVRGIVARFNHLNYKIGGFDAMVSSNVLVGSGLSSSASIEVLIGTILNYLYNDGNIPPQTIAIIGQFAENNFFGKPSGLMDQMTCAVGGIVTIDFKDPINPRVKKIDFDFSEQDYSLLVIDTGGNHADLTEDYASIPEEMRSVAVQLGGNVGRDISYNKLISNLKSVRSQVGDRAVLRMIHYLNENERVADLVASLENNNFKRFLDLVNESGNSSNKWLQNSYTIKNPQEQGVNIALSVTEDYIKKIGEGACRVHGGGFAGTVQVFLANKSVDEYKDLMENVFLDGSVQVLNFRSLGTIHINSEI